MTSLYDSLNSISDIDALIQGAVHESQVLEYKAASEPFDSRAKNEIAKDVSAMANSLGGVIIYGVATDQEIKTKPARIDGIDPKCISAFDQVVNSQVRPPIPFRKKKAHPAGRATGHGRRGGGERGPAAPEPRR